MEKIAVFGGTFNPIHNGHLHLVKSFAEILQVDRALIIPTGTPPHKQVHDLALATDRLAMCHLAIAGNSLFEINDMEIRRGGASYTSVTLENLKALYPDSELFLITGEDMFTTLADWHDSQTIFSLATICAAPRNKDGITHLLQYAEHLQKRGAKTIVKPVPYLPISSTMVREAVREGKDISGLVPAAVEAYIRKNKLYLR